MVARISFESNLWGFSGMRNMQVRKLDRFKGTKGDGLKVGTLEDIFEHEHVDKIIKI